MKKDNLKNFVLQNRQAFDDLEPSEAFMQRLSEQRHSAGTPKRVRIRMSPLRWASAAAAILLLCTALYFGMNTATPQPEIVRSATKINAGTDSQNFPTTPDTRKVSPEVNSQTQLASIEPQQTPKDEVKIIPAEKNNKTETVAQLENEALYHYTRLIEVKQKQINVLKAEEPLLFEQFSSDFEALEKSFRELKSISGHSVNQEQVLKAMIGNLEMQTELLNKQLKIIQNIKQKKHEHYEINYQRSI